MKTILITGGVGFIGSHFVKYIFDRYANYQIIVLDALTYAGNMDNIPENIKNDSRFSFWYGDVRSGELVNELVGKVDTVVHFAAMTHVSRSIYDNAVFFDVDVMGTQVVSNAVLKHMDTIDRFIHISTSEVYGTALRIPMDEEHPLNPTTPYASAKVGADRLVYSYWKTYGIPAIIIRPYNQYGFSQHLEKVIPRFITSALLNEPLTIHGSGGYTRDWVYVEDLCQALDRVIHADIDKVKGQAINIGTGRDISVREIADIILDEMGKPKELITHVSDRPGQVDRHVASTEKALRLLNWKAETAFEEGIVKTIEWYTQNKDWWKGLLWMRQVPTKNRDGRIEYH
jgi:dTDP-glucose 4,6-dehydratase